VVLGCLLRKGQQEPEVDLIRRVFGQGFVFGIGCVEVRFGRFVVGFGLRFIVLEVVVLFLLLLLLLLVFFVVFFVFVLEVVVRRLTGAGP
jgi:hypothetical protein